MKFFAPFKIAGRALRRNKMRSLLTMLGIIIGVGSVIASVSITTGFLILALHRAGLVMLTHTPNPMSFLNEICGRDPHDKPYILMVVGYPKDGATIPAHALEKRPLSDIATFL